LLCNISGFCLIRVAPDSNDRVHVSIEKFA
jgi:hypothetical protein